MLQSKLVYELTSLIQYTRYHLDPYIYIHTHFHIYIYIHIYTYLYVCLSIYLIHLSVHLSIYPSIYLSIYLSIYSYGHLSVITGYFSGIIHSINGVLLVLITGISGHNCNPLKKNVELIMRISARVPHLVFLVTDSKSRQTCWC